MKKGDEVVVIAGAEKGQKVGKIIAVKSKKQRVIVEGVRMIKKHMRARASSTSRSAIIEREWARVHISNVMAVSDFEARAAKRNPRPASA